MPLSAGVRARSSMIPRPTSSCAAGRTRFRAEVRRRSIRPSVCCRPPWRRRDAPEWLARNRRRRSRGRRVARDPGPRLGTWNSVCGPRPRRRGRGTRPLRHQPSRNRRPPARAWITAVARHLRRARSGRDSLRRAPGAGQPYGSLRAGEGQEACHSPLCEFPRKSREAAGPRTSDMAVLTAYSSQFAIAGVQIGSRDWESRRAAVGARSCARQGMSTIFPKAPDSMTASCAFGASASGSSLPITGFRVPFSRPATIPE